MAERAVAAPTSRPPRETATATGRTTAAQLKAGGIVAAAPGEQFRDEFLRLLAGLKAKGLSRDEAIAALFPKTILPGDTYEDVVTSILAGAHLLFFGPSGAGKTSLAKELWDRFPKTAWVVSGCPVLDHPLSVCDADTAARFPPCPICRRRFAPGNEVADFDPTSVDATRVPAELVRLREGFGFARVQGSSEVFPDHLTGNINLRKLEEIGDPMSPLVLEPGKLLQANRGVLLVDEIGKLPLGTQNVLLQALQEGTVTPSKSRESFPAGFVAVCTSNLSDLDNINDPLSDRLTSVHVTFNPHHAQNRRIVDLGFGSGSPSGGYVPEILLDTGVRMIEAWRLRMSDDNPDIGEVGSNRTLIDVASRTAAIATLEGRDLATADDLKAGLLHAMRGRIRARSGDAFAQNARRVEEFVGQHLEPSLKKSGTVYWCRFFRQGLRENRGEAESVVSEGRRLLQDAGLVERLALGEDGALFPRFASFRSYVAARESPRPPIREWDAAIAEFGLLERYGLFRCDEDTEGAEDDVAAAR